MIICQSLSSTHIVSFFYLCVWVCFRSVKYLPTSSHLPIKNATPKGRAIPPSPKPRQISDIDCTQDSVFICKKYMRFILDFQVCLQSTKMHNKERKKK